MKIGAKFPKLGDILRRISSEEYSEEEIDKLFQEFHHLLGKTDAKLRKNVLVNEPVRSAVHIAEDQRIMKL